MTDTPRLQPLPPVCRDEVCITCSDQAVAVEIVELLPGGLAVVDAGGGRREEVSVALVEGKVGGWVLVHAKEAIAVLDDQTAETPQGGVR